MSVRDYEERVNRASIFVTEFPQSAIDFLATHFEKAQLEEEIKRCCTRHGEDFPAILFRQRSSSNQSQSTNNPRPPFSTVLQAVPANGHFQPLQQPFPASPPTSSGSEFSHARGHAGEIVLAFDGSYQQQPLSMVKANVRHNWIRADIVHNRLRLQIRPCEGIGYVSAQFAGAPSGVLHATQQISLTWRKPDSDATEHMICYLVYERIGADLLMGEQVRKCQPFRNA